MLAVNAMHKHHSASSYSVNSTEIIGGDIHDRRICAPCVVKAEIDRLLPEGSEKAETAMAQGSEGKDE
jgi:hypothetical protein